MASYSDKGANAAPKAKKFQGKAATALNYDRAVHAIGVNRLEIQKEWINSKTLYFAKNGDQALKDYIFGKSDENPLEEISNTKNEKMQEQDVKLEKLIQVVRKFERKS